MGVLSGLLNQIRWVERATVRRLGSICWRLIQYGDGFRTRCMQRRGRRIRQFLAAIVAMVAVFAFASPAQAHPLGNFTTNQYSGLRVAEGSGTIDYVVDYAEIPAFQQRSQLDSNGNGRFETVELDVAAPQRCSSLLPALAVTIDRRAVALTMTKSKMSTRPGQGLPTLRVECSYEWAGASKAGSLQFRNSNFEDRVGWREITAVGDGTKLVESTVATASSSNRLLRYPNAELKSPLNIRNASLQFEPGGSRAPAVLSNQMPISTAPTEIAVRPDGCVPTKLPRMVMLLAVPLEVMPVPAATITFLWAGVSAAVLEPMITPSLLPST